MVNGFVHNVGWPCVVGGWLGVTETVAGLGNKICNTTMTCVSVLL